MLAMILASMLMSFGVGGRKKETGAKWLLQEHGRRAITYDSGACSKLLQPDDVKIQQDLC